ncbi:MAG: hypothetical protein Q9172_000574 [Xanthocarpia lactea]
MVAHDVMALSIPSPVVWLAVKLQTSGSMIFPSVERLRKRQETIACLSTQPTELTILPAPAPTLEAVGSSWHEGVSSFFFKLASLGNVVTDVVVEETVRESIEVETIKFTIREFD